MEADDRAGAGPMQDAPADRLGVGLVPVRGVDRTQNGPAEPGGAGDARDAEIRVRVGRAKVGRRGSRRGLEQRARPLQLGAQRLVGERRRILVAVRVVPQLVSFGHSAAKDLLATFDRSAEDEEGGARAVLGEDIEKRRRPLRRAVVEGQRDLAARDPARRRVDDPVPRGTRNPRRAADRRKRPHRPSRSFHRTIPANSPPR